MKVIISTDKTNTEEIENNKFNIGHFFIILTLLIGIVWIIWGVNEYGYYIPEIAGIFFAMGIVSGSSWCFIQIK